MNSKRISHILKSDPYSSEIFVGFGNPDIPLPKIERYPSIFILNTAPFLSEGEHWCVFCVEKRDSAFFFDPFGKPPDAYNFLPTVSLVVDLKNLQHNCKQVQGEKAKTCGHHCLFFTKQYSYGFKPDVIIARYSDVLRKNDNMVHDFVRRQYGDILAKIQL